jgi:hypothetical protein
MFGIKSIRHPELTLTRCTTWIDMKTGAHGQYTFAQSLNSWKVPRLSFDGFALQTGHTIWSLKLRWLGHTLALSIMYCVEV